MSWARASSQVMRLFLFWSYMARESTSAAGVGVEVLVSCGILVALGTKRAAWLTRGCQGPVDGVGLCAVDGETLFQSDLADTVYVPAGVQFRQPPAGSLSTFWCRLTLDEAKVRFRRSDAFADQHWRLLHSPSAMPLMLLPGRRSAYGEY